MGKKSKINTLVVKFTIQFLKLEGLPIACAKSLVYVTWRRGLKPENRGESDRVLCKVDNVVLSQKIDILCTLIQDVSTEKWKTKDKDLVLKVFAASKKLGKAKGVKGKEKDQEKEDAETKLKITEVAAIQLNLVDYANQDKPVKETYALNNQDDKPPTITFRIKAETIKFNGELLAPVADPAKEKKEAEKAEKLAKEQVRAVCICVYMLLC